jgi:hypothetical protein
MRTEEKNPRPSGRGAINHIKTYRDHLLEHPMMGPEAALMQEVKELRAALTEAQRDAQKAIESVLKEYNYPVNTNNAA